MERYGFDDVWDLLREQEEAREGGEAAGNVAGDATEMTGKETGTKGKGRGKGKGKGKGKYMSDPDGFTWVNGNPLVYRAEETDWGDQRLDIFLTPRRPGGVQPVFMDILGRHGKPISDHYGILGTFTFSKDALAAAVAAAAGGAAEEETVWKGGEGGGGGGGGVGNKADEAVGAEHLRGEGVFNGFSHEGHCSNSISAHCDRTIRGMGGYGRDTTYEEMYMDGGEVPRLTAENISDIKRYISDIKRYREYKRH